MENSEKSTSGGYFWPYLVPSSENAQNQLPEATFNNIRGQATKMLKINYWSVHWTISWNLLPSTWKMIPGACYQALWKLSLLPSTWNRILLAGTAKYSMVHLSTFPPSTFPPFQLFTFLPFYLPPFHLFPFPPFHLPLCLRNVLHSNSAIIRKVTLNSFWNMFNKWLKRVSISYLFIRHVVRAKQQQKLSESFPRKYFSPFLGPSNENAENLLPELTFDHFWGQSWKMLKIDFRRVLLTISGAKQRKCSKSIAGGHF